VMCPVYLFHIFRPSKHEVEAETLLCVTVPFLGHLPRGHQKLGS